MLGLPWRAEPTDIDEAKHLGAEPFLDPLRVATAKARALRGVEPDELVVAADTVVLAQGQVLGKPKTPTQARQMLRDLRDRPHAVITGVALWAGVERFWGGLVSTEVRMRAYADSDIDAYVERGEPFDKAGAYAIQDRLFQPVDHLQGCYLNVVGLPLCAVAHGMETLGIQLRRVGGVPPCDFCQLGAPLVEISDSRSDIDHGSRWSRS